MDHPQVSEEGQGEQQQSPASTTRRAGIDFVCVLDVSGSMEGEPLEIVKATVSMQMCAYAPRRHSVVLARISLHVQRISSIRAPLNYNHIHALFFSLARTMDESLALNNVSTPAGVRLHPGARGERPARHHPIQRARSPAPRPPAHTHGLGGSQGQDRHHTRVPYHLFMFDTAHTPHTISFSHRCTPSPRSSGRKTGSPSSHSAGTFTSPTCFR